MTAFAAPTVSFTPLASIHHPYYAEPRLVVMANVQHARDYEHVSPDDALESGVKLPAGHNIVLLPRVLSREPALETLRPKDDGEEIFLPLGFVALAPQRKVCVVFGALSSDPAKDRVSMYDELQLQGYVSQLKRAFKDDPADDTGIGGWLNVLEPTQRMLSHNQEYTFPQRPARLS